MINVGALIDSSGRYLQSAPIRVRMAGFESTTLALQNAGWQISVEANRLFDRAIHEIRVAFKHDGLRQMALGVMQFDYRDLASSNGIFDRFKHIGIDINWIAPSIQCQIVPMQMGIASWTAIDARPEYQTIRKSLDEFAMFKPIKSENFEIYINQKDEQEILEILLKKQDPKQREIRQNLVRRAYQSSYEGFEIQPNSISDQINTDIKHQIVCVGAA